MEFSKWDFRPRQRQRFVRKPGRKIPFLRILLLLALGWALYWQFDNLISASWVSRFKVSLFSLFSPQLSASPSEVAPLRQDWSPDSTRLDLRCPEAEKARCVIYLDSLHPGLGTALHALHEKIRMKVYGEESISLSSARFRWKSRFPGSVRDFPWPVSVTMQCKQATEVFTLKGAESNNASATLEEFLAQRDYCSPRHGCLRERKTAMPVRAPKEFKFQPAGSELLDRQGISLLIKGEASPTVHSALPGKLVDIRAEENGGFAAKVYHGRSLFTYYGSLSRLHVDLKIGNALEPRDTLGFVDTANGQPLFMAFSAEEAGRFVDPSAFLNIAAGEGAASHGP